GCHYSDRGVAKTPPRFPHGRATPGQRCCSPCEVGQGSQSMSTENGWRRPRHPLPCCCQSVAAADRSSSTPHSVAGLACDGLRLRDSYPTSRYIEGPQKDDRADSDRVDNGRDVLSKDAEGVRGVVVLHVSDPPPWQQPGSPHRELRG